MWLIGRSVSLRPAGGRPAWVWLLSALRFTDASINCCTFFLKTVWVLKLRLDTECGPNFPLLKPFGLCLWILDGAKLDWLGFVLMITLAKFRGMVCWGASPACLGFCPFFLIFGTLVPATTTHPKLVALVINKQNMYGTWCKAHVILEKLTVKMGNNGCQHVVDRQSTFARTCWEDCQKYIADG